MAAPGMPGEDDLSRQRQKRETRLLAQPVRGFEAMTVGDVVKTVVAATEESGGALDAQRFLEDRGHCTQTIETVLAFVGRQHGHHTPHSSTSVAP
jgi:hypothetical protein